MAIAASAALVAVGCTAPTVPEELVGSEADLRVGGIPQVPVLAPLRPICPVRDTRPGGAAVTTSSWSCPSLQEPDGLLVGEDGRTWLREVGQNDPSASDFFAGTVAANPWLTPAMLAGQHPFCVYTFTPWGGDPAVASMTRPNDRPSEYASLSPSSIDQVCVLNRPAPGRPGCPTCLGGGSVGKTKIR